MATTSNRDRDFEIRILRLQLAREHELLRRVYVADDTAPTPLARDLKREIASALDAGGDALAFVGAETAAA